RAEQTPKIHPEEHRKEHEERGDRQGAARNARLDVTADHELDDIEADEDRHCSLPGCDLCQSKECREYGGYKRAYEWKLIEHESDRAPFGRQLQARHRG